MSEWVSKGKGAHLDLGDSGFEFHPGQGGFLRYL